MKRISDKKLEKFERKKQKIQTFLDLISSDTNGVNSEKQKKDNYIQTIVNNNIEKEDNNVFTTNFKQMSELRKKLSKRLVTERPKISVEDKYLATESPEVLSIEDIQQLILATLLPPPRLSCPPNWCKVFKPTKASKVTIFVIDLDISEELFSESDFKYCVQFDVKDDWINSLLTVRLSNRQIDKMHKKRRSDASVKSNPIEISNEEKISRTELLLSPLQMAVEKYPLSSDKSCKTFCTLKSNYIPVTNRSPLYAIDCEMCFTTADKLEVTRISVVDENCVVLYDTLVKPPNEIVNYLTRFSGITKKLLDPITTTLEDVYRELDKLIPEDGIICGQSLNSDLLALQLIHPYVIDTSVIYNTSGLRPIKSSLKYLSKKFLNLDIQNHESNDRHSGHDSAEDAIATMKLVKLKLSMGLEFGDRVLSKVNYHCNSMSMNQTISINNFLETHNKKLTLFYDYVDLDCSDKLLVIYNCLNKHKTQQVSEAISRCIHSDKQICILIHKNGKCFIKY
ncbi:RNA exonuclease 5-like [Oppia nitens]|uniref:RNA exonuclease 5-like n=1 Tax=Oppia nitens TaxID=1686743 RepID=UPI0023D997B4|nr:RNA exonuclease 5-like [Oppia nitens]